MPTDKADKREEVPKTNLRLSPEDYVILTTIVIGLVGPITMLSIWQARNIYYPPVVIAILLGISIAALLYRFLGGVHDATFTIGALKVTGTAAVLVGIAWWTNQQLINQFPVFNDLKDTTDEVNRLVKENMNLKSLNDENNKNILQLDKNILQLENDLDEQKRLYKGLLSKKKLVEAISGLDPETEISKEIRRLEANRKGPWSPYSRSRSLMVSVAGYLKDKQIASCPEYYGKNLDISSDYKIGGLVVRGENTVSLRVNNHILRAIDCKDKYDYDLQVNCPDGVRIFSSKVLECGEGNEPKWKVKDRKLPVNVVFNEGNITE